MTRSISKLIVGLALTVSPMLAGCGGGSREMEITRDVETEADQRSAEQAHQFFSNYFDELEREGKEGYGPQAAVQGAGQQQQQRGRR